MMRIKLPPPWTGILPVFAEERFVAEARGRASTLAASAFGSVEERRHAPWSRPGARDGSGSRRGTGFVFDFVGDVLGGAVDVVSKHWKKIAVIAAAVTVGVLVTVGTGGLGA